MHAERQDSEVAEVEVVTRCPSPKLRFQVLGGLEGWAQARGRPLRLRELPFPGIPLILSLGSAWEIEASHGRIERQASFVAGLHSAPALVRGPAVWSCVELRLTPPAAYRVFGLPMHELANRTVALEDVLPGTRELQERVHEATTWVERFDLVEDFLARRLASSSRPSPGVEWAWQRLRRSGGCAEVGALARELGWSQRRLIARFREQIGVTTKRLARTIRFSRAVAGLRSPDGPGLAALALECGYADQAHLNREFRELAGTTPTALRAARLASGGFAE